MRQQPDLLKKRREIMRKAHFNVACMTTYPSSLIIPDSIKEGEELTYIRENLPKCKQEGDLTWLDDLEPDKAVEEEDMRGFEEIKEEDVA